MMASGQQPPVLSADFLLSATGRGQFPEPLVGEVALLGRSNSGKSSLLNRWLGRKSLARVGSTPGRTRQINFFKVTWTKETEPFLVADLPGYGFAAAPLAMVAGWRKLVADYLEAPRVGRWALLLMDIRRDPQVEEKNLTEWLKSLSIPVMVVATKADKLKSGQRALRLKLIQKELNLAEPPLAFSSLTGMGRDEITEKLSFLVKSRIQEVLVP